MLPRRGRSSPDTAFKIEVFPAPLAPTSVTRAPAGTWKETFRTASTRP